MELQSHHTQQHTRDARFKEDVNNTDADSEDSTFNIGQRTRRSSFVACCQ
jgi:hypothetical protein